MGLKQIYEGWKNHLLPSSDLKEVIQQVSVQRMEICRGCPFNSINATAAGTYHSARPDEHCTACGCTLIPKTKCLSCHCPKDKWGPELTPEEEQQIEDETKIQG